jgi:hypothetical protein
MWPYNPLFPARFSMKKGGYLPNEIGSIRSIWPVAVWGIAVWGIAIWGVAIASIIGRRWCAVIAVPRTVRAWRRGGTSDGAQCSADQGAGRGAASATRRSSEGSPGTGAEQAATDSPLSRIIRICAG